ncbi:30S ribosomal protein S3 [Patescibacteria group bacterium]|nr:30S ribosomal protein S3 [Patescibacteria group bacterium]
MGSKVNPKIIRIGQTQSWTSRWFAKKNYADFVKEDITIRKFITNKLKNSGIEKIEIERSANDIVIIITCAKPGIIIGRGGAGIDELRKKIVEKVLGNKQGIKINILEVENPNLSAAVILESLIMDIEKRIPFRRVMKQGIDRVMKAGAKGVKIIMAGRLNGVEIARTETLTEGKVPLHTFRANIDYARSAAKTTYGAIGVKVWIYKGEVFK